MVKKLLVTLFGITLLIGSPLTALAAPQQMPDGALFDPVFYAEQYPDVQAALGSDANTLYRHYVEYGKAEGRKATADDVVFDPVFYAQTYPDVAAALGTDPNALYQHYISFGRAEGRMPCAGGSAAATPDASAGAAATPVASAGASTVPAFMPKQFLTDMEVTVSSSDEAISVIQQAATLHVEHLVIHNGKLANLSSVYSQLESIINPSVNSYDQSNNNGCSVSLRTSGSKQTLTLNMRYLSSVAEEQWLDAYVSEYVKNLAGMSDYDKIRTIHDFLCERIVYDDNTAHGDGTNRSAYDGLANGIGVCSSYALGFQRIADACGIESRVLTGIANGDSHAWNVVRLNGQWYHLDCTWDDDPAGISRAYFLVGQDRMSYGNAYPGITLARTSY